MKYLDLAKSANLWEESLTKPAKPPVSNVEGDQNARNSALAPTGVTDKTGETPCNQSGGRSLAESNWIARRPPETAGWSIPWRQLYGERANAIQDEGVPFPQCEMRSFEECLAARAEMGLGRTSLPGEPPSPGYEWAAEFSKPVAKPSTPFTASSPKPTTVSMLPSMENHQ